MAWEFTPEQAWNPVETADHLKEGCLGYTKDKTETFGAVLGSGLCLPGLCPIP